MGHNPNRDGAGRVPHPFSDPPVVGRLPRSPRLPTSPVAWPNFHFPRPAHLSRSNAIRRADAPPELKDIEINGDLVKRALGLHSAITSPTPISPPAPTTTLPQFPPLRLTSLDYSTRRLPPLPHHATPRSMTSRPSRRNAMLILVPELPQELRDIQLNASMTLDEDST